MVDLSSEPAGVRASGMLADYGADVIWVEPRGGAELRLVHPTVPSVFARNKRSVTLDLSSQRDLERVRELIASADVFIDTFRPGEAELCDLTWPILKSLNSELVHCSISPFGYQHRLLDLQGYEAVVHAVVGTMGEQIGHRDGPIFQGLPFASLGAACLANIGVLAALYRRNLDGAGRHVETSLLDGALAYLSVHWGESDASVAAEAEGEGSAQGVVASTQGQRFVTRSFLCADDLYIGIHTGAVGAFGRFMKLLGLDDRIPPSETGIDMGVPLDTEQARIVWEEIPDIFATRPRAYWVEQLAKVDVCGIEHLSPGEIFDQPQALHNAMVVEVDDPRLGRVLEGAAPIRFHDIDDAPQAPSPAPESGQHTAQTFGDAEPWLAPPIHLNDCGEPAGPDVTLLEGVHILDFGAYYAGPYSSRLLADLGADVIKVEPTLGDQLRGLERCFYSAQAGKRSLAADLKDPGLKPAIESLLAWADIVHHNLRPGAAERLGLGYDDLRAARPDGIYLHAPGWGSSGPNMNRQSFAPMLSGLAGITFAVAGEFNPPLPPVATEDPGNGLLGAVAMLLALLFRQRTGQGGYVENPQLNATMAHMAHVVRHTSGEVIGFTSLDPLQMGVGALERLYETADGWLCLCAFSDKEIHGVEAVLGISIVGDPRFDTAEHRHQHDYALTSLIGDVLQERKTAEVENELRGLGVAAVRPAGHNTHHFLNDGDERRIGRVAECAHPKKGRVRELDQLIRVSDCRVPPHRLAPELGEHSEGILTQFGYDSDDIKLLKARGAVS